MPCIQENDDQMLGFWSSSAISVLCRLKFWVEFRIIWMTIDHGPLRVGKNYIWIMHWEPHVSIKRKNHREIPLYVCSLMGSCNHVGISRNNFFLRTVCSVPLLLNLEFPIHGMTIIDLSSCSAWILNLIRKQREMIEILNSFHHSSYSHNLQTLSSSQCIFCTFLPPIFCIHWDFDMFQFILLGCLQVNHLALIIIIIVIAILNNVIFPGTPTRGPGCPSPKSRSWRAISRWTWSPSQTVIAIWSVLPFW